MDGYKEHLKTATEYINIQGKINWQSLESLLQILSRMELKFLAQTLKESDSLIRHEKVEVGGDIGEEVI